MELNENIIKNIANEVSQVREVVREDSDQKNLQFFVEHCVDLITREDTSLNTLKIQYIMQTNYDKLQNLIDKNIESISGCLRPLVNEIVNDEPAEDDAEYKKLFRKLSIYIVLASGLGNPGVIVTLKEGMAALESVFSMNDLKMFITLPRNEKLEQLNDLLEIVSGVRLFNRDCKKGGDGIPGLLVDAGKACVASLSSTLVAVMQRVNMLTTAIADTICIQDETGNVYVEAGSSNLTVDECYEIIHLLAFHRQYELFTRQLLSDAKYLVEDAVSLVDRVKEMLQELHTAVKYKAAVPVATVYPMFTKLWRVWRSMQNVMYLVATVNRLSSALSSVQDQIRVPYITLERLLKEKEVVSDEERMTATISMEQRLSMGTLRNYVASGDSASSFTENVQFLGFCALCLSAGALIPSNMKVGLIKSKGRRYGFCCVTMATRFSRDPDRYINEVLEYARKNPHMINVLGVKQDLYKVKDIDALVEKYTPKIKVQDKHIQTEVHPLESYIERNYTWNMWELKRRACQWATIVKCQTHATQTHHSHMRSEIHCQTVEQRDKGFQTKRDVAVSAAIDENFFWGLRGQLGYGQHTVKLKIDNDTEKKKAQVFSACTWPCIEQTQNVKKPVRGEEEK
ncbi:hypothetical protein ACJJTC_005206 [Scirpophaga incertulas]